MTFLAECTKCKSDVGNDMETEQKLQGTGSGICVLYLFKLLRVVGQQRLSCLTTLGICKPII